MTTGRLGCLTYEQALVMHNAGCDALTIAVRADVTTQTVTRWRRANKLSRSYRPTGLSTDDRKAYQRQWHLMRRRQGVA